MLLLVDAAFVCLRTFPRKYEGEISHRSKNGWQDNGRFCLSSAGNSRDAKHRNKTHRDGCVRRGYGAGG